MSTAVFSFPEPRRLSNPEIQGWIDQALNSLPPTGAVTAYIDSSGSVRGTISAKLGKNWSVVFDGEAWFKPSGTEVSGRAAVRLAW